MIQINTLISQQDFIRFHYRHFFRRPMVMVLTAIFGLVFLSSIFSNVMIRAAGQDAGSITEQLLQLLVIPAIFALICWSVYAQSKQNYNSTNSLHEPVLYTFTEKGVHVKGRSFENDLSWEAIYKVQETSRWFVLYQNNVVATLVPKAAFKDQEQVKELRTLIASQKNPKHSLSKA